MIIKCVNCNKKFEVNRSLIPDNGRTIQCGSCNHIWFFNLSLEKSPEKLIENNVSEQILEHKITEVKEEEYSVTEETLNKIDKAEILGKTNKTTAYFSLSKILSYFIVAIISSIALIIILNTFESPLDSVFPSLELLLYNLFETIKDVFLFIDDLFI